MSTQVAEALRRLASLLSSHPNPGLSKRLLEPLLLPLWSLASWTASGDELEAFQAPARFLLQILLQLSSGQLMSIAQNLVYQGNRDESKLCWTYRPASGEGIEIEKWSGHDDRLFDEFALKSLDEKVKAFIELLKPLREQDDVPALFLFLCRRLLMTPKKAELDILLLNNDTSSGNTDLLSQIIDAKLLQSLMDSLPERLVSDSSQILELVSEVLENVIRSGEDVDGDDTVAVALSLLNMVFTTKSSGQASSDPQIDKSIKDSLRRIAGMRDTEASTTARNLLMLLDFQAADSVLQPHIPVAVDRNLEDRRTHSLAMSYLTSTDSLPPVRAQGLDMLSSLITSASPILDIPALIILLSSTLQDSEEYIYLRVIKLFIQLSIRHPKAVLLGLLDRYIDPNEESPLNTRLGLGEALLQVMEKAGETFTGDLAHRIGTGLLSIASRRGHRPKHAAEQHKASQLALQKNLEAETAWDGPVPQFEDADPNDPAPDPLLAQILDGWDSKRGAEDLRIRTSALSILGSAIEINIAGLGASLTATAIDVSLHILTLETAPEAAILRRAGMLCIMSLLRALDHARDGGRRLGFGLSSGSVEDVGRVVGYVAATDGDGLVRGYATDVLEGLRMWEVKALVVPQQGDEGGVRTELAELAGLAISPGGGGLSGAGNSKMRPRIEEVE